MVLALLYATTWDAGPQISQRDRYPGHESRSGADSENWTSADTKSEPPGSDGGAVAGRVSGGPLLFLARVIGGAETIDSGCGLWAGQGGQHP